MRHYAPLLTLLLACPVGGQEVEAPSTEAEAPSTEAEAGEPSYDASGAWVPTPGAKLETNRGGHLEAKFVVRQEGRVVQKNDSHQEYFRHRYLDEIQAVDEGELRRSLRTYEVVKDSLYPQKLDVRGMQVLVQYAKGGAPTFLSPSGDPPKTEKEQSLHNVIQGEAQRGLPTMERVLHAMLPRQPLALGESWEVSARDILMFFDPSAIEEPDPEAVIACGGTLEEVIEQEGGPALLRLSIQVDLRLEHVLFMTFDEPGRLQLEGEILIAAGSESPQREVKVSGSFVGNGKAGSYEQDFDVTLSLEETVRVVGELPAKAEPAPAPETPAEPAPAPETPAEPAPAPETPAEPAPRKHYY